MAKPAINRGKLVWAGEHWINAIRTEGADRPSGWFSLYLTRYSEVGEGIALQLVIPSADISLVCTDNPRVGRWIADRFFTRSSIKTPEAPILPARFAREGATHDAPAWIAEIDHYRVVARWQCTEPPVMAYGPFRAGVEFFTLLFFTRQSTIELDGKPIQGSTYLRDLWKPTIGAERSSSVYALSESLIEPAS